VKERRWVEFKGADQDSTGGRPYPRRTNPDGRGLPRTIGTQQPEDLPCFHLQIDAIERGHRLGAGIDLGEARDG